MPPPPEWCACTGRSETPAHNTHPHNGTRSVHCHVTTTHTYLGLELLGLLGRARLVVCLHALPHPVQCLPRLLQPRQHWRARRSSTRSSRRRNRRARSVASAGAIGLASVAAHSRAPRVTRVGGARKHAAHARMQRHAQRRKPRGVLGAIDDGRSGAAGVQTLRRER
eukprot:187117-Chlamydomonas_euryale.AAC.2